jgi:phage terminase large subunit-like protein
VKMKTRYVFGVMLSLASAPVSIVHAADDPPADATATVSADAKTVGAAIQRDAKVVAHAAKEGAQKVAVAAKGVADTVAVATKHGAQEVAAAAKRGAEKTKAVVKPVKTEKADHKPSNNPDNKPAQ